MKARWRLSARTKAFESQGGTISISLLRYFRKVAAFQPRGWDPRKSENTPKCLVEARPASEAPSFLPPGEMMIPGPPLSTCRGPRALPPSPLFIHATWVTAATIDSCTFLFRPLGIPIGISMSLDNHFQGWKEERVSLIIIRSFLFLLLSITIRLFLILEFNGREFDRFGNDITALNASSRFYFVLSGFLWESHRTLEDTIFRIEKRKGVMRINLRISK